MQCRRAPHWIHKRCRKVEEGSASIPALQNRCRYLLLLLRCCRQGVSVQRGTLVECCVRATIVFLILAWSPGEGPHGGATWSTEQLTPGQSQ
ncbi:hypothetical protein XELAEV_18039278mg [Xenopus laevis]|uniref:Uncharacterized protein n=1 Tax=Xenopus laevis TaxID=8355 RepID=A0A974H7P7_XENLA|nr:hypothetical protein XELAEV_18039278mg [Xenopus laevis]